MKYRLLNLFTLLLLLSPLMYADDSPVTAIQTPPPPQFSQQQLDQMLAPIALYPDALLSQVLQAATYPLEVVQAARWSRAHPDLNGDAAVQQARQNNWDPSVVSLTAFPQVLEQMDEKLDWTEQLGDAFLAQQPQVMDTVQNLRQKASAAGNLQSNQQISVATQPALGAQAQTIVIQQAAPQVVYVPYYNPTVVYGPWWWDAYPPVYWDPWPGYAYSSVRSGFYFGSGISVSAGFFYSNVDWRRRHVNIVNVNNYYYHDRHDRGSHDHGRNDGRPDRGGQPGNGPGNRPDGGTGRPWQHNPEHRRGVTYSNPAVQQQFTRGDSPADNRRAERNSESRNWPNANPSDTRRNRDAGQPNASPTSPERRNANPEARFDNSKQRQERPDQANQLNPANAGRIENRERPINQQQFNRQPGENRRDSQNQARPEPQIRSIQSAPLNQPIQANPQPRPSAGPSPTSRESGSPGRMGGQRSTGDGGGNRGNHGGERNGRQ
ncbi:MAG: DUF3300 domain-containing protein [Pseudomonadota bacterium]